MSPHRATTPHKAPRPQPLLIGPNPRASRFRTPTLCFICPARVGDEPRLSFYYRSPKGRVQHPLWDVCHDCAAGGERAMKRRMRRWAKFLRERAEQLEAMAQRPIRRLPEGEGLPALRDFPVVKEGQP